MNGTKMTGVVAIVAIAGMAFTVKGTQAQSAAARNGVDVAKAVRYEAAAARVATTKQYFGEAAHYFEMAAQLRPTGDCQAVKDMVDASRLRYYLGDEGKAQSLLENAGNVALQYGDVKTAAKSFLDAAWIARERGSHAIVVQALISKAQKLAQSPLLDTSERDALLGRIAAEPQ
jgi:hypothetical protein